MTRRWLPLLTFTAASAALTSACGGKGSSAGGIGDAAALDICDSPDAGDAQCQLSIVQPQQLDAGFAGQQFYIDHAGKQLWLWIQLPQSLPPSTLFHLVAGYDVPSTPVNLAVNILEANLETSIALGTDDQGSGAPKPLSFTFDINPKTTPAGSIVWVEVTDATNTNYDVHHPFNIYVTLEPDPDPNVGTTTINLGAANSGIQTGTCANGDGGACEGVLSVTGRTDTFSVTVPSGVNRPILYLDLSAPTANLSPPALYDLAYSVSNSIGTQINSGNVPDPETPANLSAALLVTAGQTYTIQVFGLNPNDPQPAPPGPGDIRLTYNLNVEVMPDLDVNEPNDNIGETLSHPIAMTLGSKQTLTGRIAYIGDSDWFNLQFPSSGTTNTRLHYKFTPGTSGNRYPAVGEPLPGPDRVANLSLLISGQNAVPTCLQDLVQCPRDPGYADNRGIYQGQLFNSLCANGDGDGGALCLLSGRNEPQAVAEGFEPLQNFEGIFPLTGTGAQTLYLDFQSSSGQYCDDLPYTLELDWEPMPGQPPSSMADPIAASFPFDESGVFAAGYGDLINYNLTETPPVDVRGQYDYDAIPSNVDTYEVAFPSQYIDAALGASWQLSWTLTDPNGGRPAEGLLLGVTFCDAMGACSFGGPAQGGVEGALYYNSVAYEPWWNPGGAPWYTPSLALLWSETPTSGGFTIASTPFDCTCFESQYLAGGKFYVTVQGADRTQWTDTDYELKMGISSYTSATFDLDGGIFSCPVSKPEPVPVVDAGGKLVDAGNIYGCEFINNQDYK